MNSINIEEIKKYNEGLKAHTERAAKIKAELEINTNELNRLCAELTQELGISVTAETIDAIYAEQVSKINETLKTGKEVLERIEREEQAIQNRPQQVAPQFNTPAPAPAPAQFEQPINAFGQPQVADTTEQVLTNPGVFGMAPPTQTAVQFDGEVTELPPFNVGGILSI